MLQRRKSKALLNAEAKFKAAVTKHFSGLGARQGHWYQFELDTPAGLLHVSVYDDWVATRFDNVARGTEFTRTCGHRCNPYSGKWNFHFGDGTAKSLAPQTVLSELDDDVDLLMHWEPDAPTTRPNAAPA